VRIRVNRFSYSFTNVLALAALDDVEYSMLQHGHKLQAEGSPAGIRSSTIGSGCEFTTGKRSIPFGMKDYHDEEIGMAHTTRRRHLSAGSTDGVPVLGSNSGCEG
jgi:hypothetical protein